MKAKNTILVNQNSSMAFTLYRRKNKALIDYFTDKEFDCQLECEVDKANEIYSKALKDGFVEV